MQPIDQQLQALNMDIACGVMNTVVIGDLQKVIENHNTQQLTFLPQFQITHVSWWRTAQRIMGSASSCWWPGGGSRARRSMWRSGADGTGWAWC